MLLQVTQEELNNIFILSMILIIVKVGLVLYTGYKIIERKKQTGEFNFGFLFGIFCVMVCLLISRIIYIYWDIYLTKFDSTTFHLMPNVLIWKIGAFVLVIGYAIFIYIIDKRILDFKFKGSIAYLLIIIGILQFIWPVNTAEDFQFITIFSLFANIIAIIIPIIFFNLAKQKSPYRMASISVAMGIIMYAIGANFTNEAVMSSMTGILGNQARTIVFLISIIIKIIGLNLLAYGVIKFASKFSQ